MEEKYKKYQSKLDQIKADLRKEGTIVECVKSSEGYACDPDCSVFNDCWGRYFEESENKGLAGKVN